MIREDFFFHEKKSNGIEARKRDFFWRRNGSRNAEFFPRPGGFLAGLENWRWERERREGVSPRQGRRFTVLFWAVAAAPGFVRARM